MSEMPMPETRAGAMSRDTVRGLASSWWLFLILGILWILFGMFVLSYNVGSLLALALFAGFTFIGTGITQVISAGRAESWRWLLLGIWAAGYPGRSLFVFVNVVGIFAMFYGFSEIFAAFDLRRLDHRLDRPAVRPAE